MLTLYIKLFQLNNQLIFMAYFHHCENFPDIQIHLKPSLAEHNTSRTCFSKVLSMIGITAIQIFIILAIIAHFTIQLKFIRLVERKTYHIHYFVGIQFLARSRFFVTNVSSSSVTCANTN